MQQGSPNGRIRSVEGHAPPPDGYTSWDGYMADVEAAAAVDGYCPAVCARLSKAIRLAPNGAVLNALLEGQPVPVSALDPAWTKRYGL